MTLLEKYQSLSPNNKDWNTNHLPMVITALKQLDVPMPFIESFATQYVAEKGIADLGDKFYIHNDFEESYVNKTNMYTQQINKIGKTFAIKKFFNVAENSLSSGLYHGLIRLYYSIIEDNDLMLAQALAYFELINSEYSLHATVEEDTSAFEKLESFRKTSSFLFKTNGSMSKFNELVAVKEVTDSLFTLRNLEAKEDQMLDLFLTQYLKTNDFYILHVITGFHALLSLKKYFKDYESVLEQFFLTAQVFMMFNDYKTVMDVPNPSDLEALKDRISELSDAHDIKLFFTINKLYEQFGNDKLKQVGTLIFK